MDSVFTLYPDCKLVKGKHSDAIYDLTRNAVYSVPHEISSFFKEGRLDILSLPEEKRQETEEFLLENELGRFDMPKEFQKISEVFISPSIISNAIIDIGKKNLPLLDIAKDLSELVCETVLLHFIGNFSLEHTIMCSKIFMPWSMNSIEIALLYEEGIDSNFNEIIREVPLCTRLLIVNSPFTRTDSVRRDVLVRYTEKGLSSSCVTFNHESFANANLTLFCESLQHDNCLNGKVAVDQDGNIRNCPECDEIFGNVKDISLLDVVEKRSFRERWNLNKDKIEKCKDCELRYACQLCVFSLNACKYNLNGESL